MLGRHYHLDYHDNHNDDCADHNHPLPDVLRFERDKHNHDHHDHDHHARPMSTCTAGLLRFRRWGMHANAMRARNPPERSGLQRHNHDHDDNHALSWMHDDSRSGLWNHPRSNLWLRWIRLSMGRAGLEASRRNRLHGIMPRRHAMQGRWHSSGKRKLWQ